MTPPPGARIQKFVGDSLHVRIEDRSKAANAGWKALMRTNLGRASTLRREILSANAEAASPAGECWRDIPMLLVGDGWELHLPLAETGFFRAKAYLRDPAGWQHWPEGPDLGISVHPDECRSGNLIYCAFPRMFGATKALTTNTDSAIEKQLQPYDSLGYTIIPPSGKLRDLKQALPHIFNELGCRILHLLPVHPTPTTYARFGRFGSPYAALDLTAIDPALVEFDKRTTGVDQFCELTYATHLLGGRVFLDIVINHTGWGSVLQEHHPEWFLRIADGSFASPGAWGTVWEDLVELRHANLDLWDKLASMFLTWCRRGVDGFRCDAGYKVPVDAWRYIIARVQDEFPGAVFLLEGLGGAWEATEALLTEGGMHWAYSELFQNHTAQDVHRYLRHSLKESERVGLLVHYSETHDNVRLAAKGRTWSLLRNRLCALTAVSGGFGFTCGVEWLATEKIRVHGSTGMNWGAGSNILRELKQLNLLLAEHPCFQDGAKIEVLSAENSPILVMRRALPETGDELLVLVNTDPDNVQSLALADLGYLAPVLRQWVDLLGQASPPIGGPGGAPSVALAPGAAYCLAPQQEFKGLSGTEYRRRRSLAAFAIQALTELIPAEAIAPPSWQDLAALVDASPEDFLAAVSLLGKTWESGKTTRLCSGDVHQAFAHVRSGTEFRKVLEWSLPDQRRILPVPPDHWILIRDSVPFRCAVSSADEITVVRKQSVHHQNGHFAYLAPGSKFKGVAKLQMERYEASQPAATGQLVFLDSEPTVTLPVKPRPEDIVLLTNGRGAMARICVDLGRVVSKYDCVLGANCHPDIPVDRHIMVKRVRVWVNADGFITPVDFSQLASFALDPLPTWEFVANAGDGRTVQIRVQALMVREQNTVAFRFSRPGALAARGKQLPVDADVRLTVRPDVEDRNFHQETKRNPSADAHFSMHCHVLDGGEIGFHFTPAKDRHLKVTLDSGVYHPQPEWSHNIPHPVEQTRGQEGFGDSYSPGWFEIPLPKDSSTVLTIAAGGKGPVTRTSFDPHQPDTTTGSTVSFERILRHACEAFVVRRGHHKTVIAGYPWFLDWGRDTLICARGLIAAGMIDEVLQLLITFARFEDRGTLPNTIHGEDASNRDTSDAPLWFGVVLEELASRCGADLYKTKVHSDGRTFLSTIRNIAHGYLAGTPNGIRVDPESKLVWSPPHFTWMDTNYPACTPRAGYPIEIQALWIRLLNHLAKVDSHKLWDGLAKEALESVEARFWLEEPGWFSDVLLSSSGESAKAAIPDDALRSNCLFLPSLGLADDDRARRCVTAARRFLVVPGALRTLAPLPLRVPLPNRSASGALLNDPVRPYWGTYEGDEDTRRKPAYHNGSAWTWTFPTFCEAMARAWHFSAESVQASRAYLLSMRALLEEGCLGHLPEVLDGDAPHRQRGCDAQAWGATEALRVWKLVSEA